MQIFHRWLTLTGILVYYLPMLKISEYFDGKLYPGRTVIEGVTADGKLFMAYMLQGRSVNSRNRKLVKTDSSIDACPIDESLVQNRDLIIYKALVEDEGHIWLTNGDQSVSIMKSPSTLEGVMERTYENDGPIFTPRIGTVISREDLSSEFFIIKKNGDETERRIWHYPAINGVSHIIHTYMEDENLTSFTSSPVMVETPCCMDACLEELSGLLANDNTVSLLIRIGDEEKIINLKEEA